MLYILGYDLTYTRIHVHTCSGVIAKQYKEIRGSIKRIVVNTLFDPSALEEYFTGHKKYAVEMLHLGNECTCTIVASGSAIMISFFLPPSPSPPSL